MAENHRFKLSEEECLRLLKSLNKQKEDNDLSDLEPVTNVPLGYNLLYLLKEALSETESSIKERPNRELSLVKTKIQEALFWATEDFYRDSHKATSKNK